MYHVSTLWVQPCLNAALRLRQDDATRAAQALIVADDGPDGATATIPMRLLLNSPSAS
jgi:hypothetical protein